MVVRDAFKVGPVPYQVSMTILAIRVAIQSSLATTANSSHVDGAALLRSRRQEGRLESVEWGAS